MENVPAPYALGPREGEAFWAVDGALTTVKANGESTGGRLAIIEDLAQAGEGTPLHVHRDDDESFYVLEGDVTFWLGDDPPVRGRPGTFVHVPGGVAHAFRVDSETARYLIITTPQHGEFYRAISEPAPERVLPPAGPMDMEKVEAACAAYGVEILGPPPESIG
jgi:quercetin dioxygenase-like cupin family protein